MRRAIFLFLFFILAGGSAFGQVFVATLGDPIYWDANTETDVVDYRVFRSDSPCIDPTPTPAICGNFIEVAVVGQGPDPINWIQTSPIVFVQDYFYRVTARNSSNRESLFSNELNVRWLNPDAPAPPGSLRGTEQGARLWIDWDDPDPKEHVAVWNVYKSTQEIELGALLGMTGVSEYRDVNPGRRGPRFYNVTAVNDSGIESKPAGPVVYDGRRR